MLMRKLLTIIENLVILPLGCIIWLVYKAYLQALVIEQIMDRIQKGKK